MELRAAREQSGKTQAQVAREAGVTEISYQRYEAGSRIPSATTAILIARFLNTTVEAIFGAATPKIAETPGGNRANPEENTLSQE